MSDIRAQLPDGMAPDKAAVSGLVARIRRAESIAPLSYLRSWQPLVHFCLGMTPALLLGPFRTCIFPMQLAAWR